MGETLKKKFFLVTSHFKKILLPERIHPLLVHHYHHHPMLQTTLELATLRVNIVIGK